jgi:hypothetical protein
MAAYVGNERFKTFAQLIIARFCFALTGWARSIDAFQKCLAAPRIGALCIEPGGFISTIENTILTSAARLRSITCKEHALCCWFMLHSAGIRARLVMGVRLSPFSGHCWCEVDGHVLMDTRENCETYTTLVTYG